MTTFASSDRNLSSPRGLTTSTDTDHPLLFVPPTTTCASSSPSTPYYSSTSCSSRSADCVSRKRIRHNGYTPDLTFPTPRISSHIEDSSTQSSITCLSGVKSPVTLINTDYRLAEGIDTPMAVRLEEEERYEIEQQEVDYRPNRSTYPTRGVSFKPPPRKPAPDADGVPTRRKRAYSGEPPGWGRVVVNIMGGVAGKVINFCWNSAFRGFQAGAGQASQMKNDTLFLVEHTPWMNVDEKDDVFGEKYRSSRHHASSVPGYFPEDGFINDYMSHPQAHRAEELPAYGYCSDGWMGSPKGRWVVVNNSEVNLRQASTPSQSPLRISRNKGLDQEQHSSSSPTTATGIRSRSSFTDSPGSRSSQTASFASPRGSPRRTGRVTGRIGADSRPRYLTGHRSSRSSLALSRQVVVKGPRQSLSVPASPDVERFEKKMRRKEKKDEEDMQRLNRQLQDMIRQGKEALKTTVEVEDGSDEDEGFGEGLEVMAATKW